MQSRRWWQSAVLVAVLAAGFGVKAATPTTPEITEWDANAQKWTADKAKSIVDLCAAGKDRDAAAEASLLTLQVNLPPNNANILFKNAYGAGMADILIKNILENKQANGQARALAASSLVLTQISMGSGAAPIVSADAQLRKMLLSPDASARYWGAKGLATLMPVFDIPNAAGNNAKRDSINALKAALARKDDKGAEVGETDDVVKAQMLKALGLAGEVKTVADEALKTANQFKSKAASVSDCGAITADLEALATAINQARKSGKPAAADLATAAKAAAVAASFVAQHADLAQNGAASADAKQEAAHLLTAAGETVNAAVNVFNVAAESPTAFAKVTFKNSIDLIFAFDELTDPKNPAGIQKYFKDIAKPDRVSQSSATSAATQK